MRLALAGFGDVGRRFAITLCDREEVVVLTSRDLKPSQKQGWQIHVTDYSVSDLKLILDECDAVISTLSGPSDFYISTHSNLLEACKQSVKCKYFIPSEWNINIEDFPDVPMFSAPYHNIVRDSLRSQQDVQWTMICHGFSMEYVLPRDKNPLREIGAAWVMDHEAKVFDIYGDGLQKVTLTCLDDVARAVVAILKDSIATGSPLPQVTHLSGQTITYKDLYELVKTRDSSWKAKFITISEILDEIYYQRQRQGPELAIHQMRLLGFTNANHSPEEKVLKWGTGILTGLTPFSVESLLDSM